MVAWFRNSDLLGVAPEVQLAGGSADTCVERSTVNPNPSAPD